MDELLGEFLTETGESLDLLDVDVVQYRGALMPLVYIDEERRRCDEAVQPVLVFTEGGRPIGLAIDEIVDIVEERLTIEIRAEAPGIIGAAIIKGKAVEIVDVSHYLGKGLGQRLIGKEGQLEREVKLLLVDDSQFFRNMLAPLLTASGYVDKVGDVLRLTRSSYEANPVNLDAYWAQVCAGVHRLENDLMVVLDVDKVLDLSQFGVAA
jgi:chemotaxis signal transduction protein